MSGPKSGDRVGRLNAELLPLGLHLHEEVRRSCQDAAVAPEAEAVRKFVGPARH